MRPDLVMEPSGAQGLLAAAALPNAVNVRCRRVATSRHRDAGIERRDNDSGIVRPSWGIGSRVPGSPSAPPVRWPRALGEPPSQTDTRSCQLCTQ
jgi:hypothetical protein